MPTDDPRERLLPSAARARARSLSGGPAEPGDLFVLRATADLPVEWAILDRRPGDELLAVPADASPFAGSADVEVPASAPGGPLCLRCRFGTWLDDRLFEPGLRSGSLAPETVAEARQQVRRLEAGTLEPSPLAEEVDADSEYRDWLREVPERARGLALEARPAAAWKPHPGLGGGYPLAATFALLAVGLGIWVAVLRGEVDRRPAPIFDVPSRNNSIVLGERTRGRSVVEVPPEAGYVLLVLSVESTIPPQPGRFEILDAKRQVVWQSGPMPLTPDSERWLAVERSRLPDGEYSIRIVPAAGGRPLAESKVGIETAREPSGKRDFSP
ncbi:MAG TPA: hypothetical protein VIJ61_07155 [Thermoanaerobaculia bacterium]